MNREIKFRAWDKKTEQIFTVEGLNWSSVDKQLQTVYSMSDFGALQNGQNSGDYRRTDEEVELMQYTGLKDKNGVEIYEGDIVKILYTDWPSQLDNYPELSHEQYLDMLAETKVVIWKVQGFYVSSQPGGYAESMEPGTHGYIQVIGNIYEHGHLLEATK